MMTRFYTLLSLANLLPYTLVGVGIPAPLILPPPSKPADGRTWLGRTVCRVVVCLAGGAVTVVGTDGYRGQGESLVPLYTRESVSLSQALTDIARHVMKRMLNPRNLS